MKKSKLVWLGIAGAALGLLGWLVLRPDMNGVIIGQATVPLHFRTVSALNKKPLIDFRLFGRYITYPEFIPDIDKAKLDPDIAGIIFVETANTKGNVRWRIDGEPLEVAPTGFDKPSIYQPGWEFQPVPYASGEDHRQAQLFDGREWVNVTLPYKPQMVPRILPTLTVQAGPYVIEAIPEPRRVRPMNVRYHLAIRGKADVIAIGEVHYSGFPGMIDSWATRFRPEDYDLTVARRGVTEVKGLLFAVKKATIPIVVSEGNDFEAVMTSKDGRLLMDRQGFHFKKQGFLALDYKGTLFHTEDQSGNGFIAEAPESTATAYRAVRSYPFRIVLTNSEP